MDSLIRELREELEVEIEWRIGEISILKSVPLTLSLVNRRKILQKYSIPAFYALWEGFVVAAFEIYTKKINELQLCMDTIHPCILTHDIDMKNSLKDGRVNFVKQIEYVTEFKNYFSSNLNIIGKVPTKSNVKYKTINNILSRFNLDKFDKSTYEFKFKKLLMYRNDIAHGENSLNVDGVIVQEMSDAVIQFMDELSNILVKGFTDKTYLK